MHRWVVRVKLKGQSDSYSRFGIGTLSFSLSSLAHTTGARSDWMVVWCLLAGLCRILLPPNAQESRGKKSAAVKIYLHSAAEGHHLRLKTCAVKLFNDARSKIVAFRARWVTVIRNTFLTMRLKIFLNDKSSAAVKTLTIAVKIWTTAWFYRRTCSECARRLS